MSGHQEREQLTLRADEARAKLLHTVEQLDRRRHDALDLRLQLRRHLGRAVAAAALLVILTAGAAAVLVHRIASAPARRRSDRWRLAKHLWRHPNRAMRAERLPFFQEIGRSLLFAILSTAATLPARRAVAHALSRRSSDE